MTLNLVLIWSSSNQACNWLKPLPKPCSGKFSQDYLWAIASKRDSSNFTRTKEQNHAILLYWSGGGPHKLEGTLHKRGTKLGSWSELHRLERRMRQISPRLKDIDHPNFWPFSDCCIILSFFIRNQLEGCLLGGIPYGKLYWGRRCKA